MDSLPDGLRLRILPIEISLDRDETISCVTTFKSNLYLGTSAGNILHFHNFDDTSDYILILKLPVSDKPITKLLTVPDIELCLVLCARVLYPYSLPELSPIHIGKIKDVSDMLRLSQVRNPKVKNKHDKVIVYTSTKIRLVQFLPDTVKLLRDINYSGALVGISSASGTLANYSNICLVANDANYDVVDLQQTRRISLFEYNSENTGFSPNIVHFAPREKPHEEEYLLTIASDAATSMAMFINSFGDVTRGTLTWINEGYPTNGVVVEWPHAIGLFRKNGNLTLTFSSLELLLVVLSTELRALELEEDFRIAKVEDPVRVEDAELLEMMKTVGLRGETQKMEPSRTIASSVLLYAQHSVFLLCHEEPLVVLVTQLLVTLRDSQEVAEFTAKFKEIVEPFAVSVHAILLLISGELGPLKEMVQAQTVDPRILLYLFEGYPTDSDSWKDLTVPSALLEIMKLAKANYEAEKDFESWLIAQVHKGNYAGPVREYFRTLFYKNQDSTAQVLELVDTEKDYWQGQSPSNDELMDHFQKQNFHFVRLHVLYLKQQAGALNSDEIIDLGLALLSKKVEDKETAVLDAAIAIGTLQFDLVKLTFLQLRDNVEDSEQYTRKLLELLKLYPERGLELLKANKRGKHNSTHRFILEDLSKSHALNSSFWSLKIEYMEQAFEELLAEKQEIDVQLLVELLLELVQYLRSHVDALHDEFENLNIFFATFKVENSLRDSKWPKLYWVEFLHLHRGLSECKVLAELYLKIYELTLVKTLMTSEKTEKVEISVQNDAMKYLDLAFRETDQEHLIQALVDIGDYSVAEWVAVHGIVPLPRRTMYFDNLRQKVDKSFTFREPSEAKASVKHLIAVYLGLEDSFSRCASVRHMVNRFAKRYFSATEILELLPADFPMAYIYEYLSSVMVELEAEKTDSALAKILTKLDAKFTEKVYEDFRISHKDVLEEHPED